VLHDGHFCVSNRSCMMLRVSPRHATFWVMHITAWGTSERQCGTTTRIWPLLKICRTRWTWDELTATWASHTSHLATWRQLWSARNIFLVCVLVGDWCHNQCSCLFIWLKVTKNAIQVHFLLQPVWLTVGQDSSVGIVVHCGLDGLGIESLWGQDFCTCPDWHWGPPCLLYNRYRVFPGCEAAGAWHWTPTPI
jgi:hypothetical protein